MIKLIPNKGELMQEIEIVKGSIEFIEVEKRIKKRMFLNTEIGEKVVSIYRNKSACINAPKTYNYYCLFWEWDYEAKCLFVSGSDKFSFRNTEKYFLNNVR